jgi:hypothetical protein
LKVLEDKLNLFTLKIEFVIDGYIKSLFHCIFHDQAALNWPKSVHICGDIYEFAAPNTKDNIDAVNVKRGEAGL